MTFYITWFPKIMDCLVISRSFFFGGGGGHCDNFKKLGQGSWTDGLLMDVVLMYYV